MRSRLAGSDSTEFKKPKTNEPPPLWVSEVAADLHGWRIGAQVNLPLGGALRPFTIAGIYRDYVRQNGAAVIQLARYIELTGDRAVNDAAIWLAPGTRLVITAIVQAQRPTTRPGTDVLNPARGM